MSIDPIPVRRRASWPLWAFRVAVTIAAVLMFNQAIFAGQFLSGSYSALLIHRTMSTVTVVFVAVTLIAAVLLRWPGRGPWWPILGTIVLFGLTALQTFAGYRALLGLHIPLGVTVILLVVALAVWAWHKR